MDSHHEDHGEPAVQPVPTRPMWVDALLIVSVTMLLVLIGVSIFQPWLSGPLARSQSSAWLTLQDGHATLQVTRDATGQVVRWTSGNIARVPVRQLLAGHAGSTVSDALEAAYPGALNLGDVPGLEVLEIRNRVREAHGAVHDEIHLLTQDASGTRLLGYSQPDNRVHIAFTPPLLLYPADPRPGMQWQETGVRSDGLPYAVAGHILARGPYQSALGEFDDCIQTEVTTTFTNTVQSAPSAPPVVDAFITVGTSWECATVGTVAWTNAAPDGSIQEQGETVAATAATAKSPTAPTLPHAPPPPLPSLDELAALTDWQLQRVARLVPLYRRDSAATATIPPLFVPSESPVVLAAGIGSDLTAYDAETGAVRWRYHPGGTVYSPLTLDPDRSQVLFGSSTKSLVALDYDGLFRWSFATGDNIASKPVVHQDLVVFGSEDRTIYAVDAASGALRWRYDTGGPVASSPAVYQPADSAPPLVITGADDGGVYALDLTTGDLVWQFAAEDAVEAPIAIGEAVAYIAARDGNLYALDAATGAPLWTAAVGRTLRTAPVVGRESVYVLDQFDTLHAINRRHGGRVWSLNTLDTGAPPLRLDGPDGADWLLVPHYESGVSLVDAAGVVLHTWTSPNTNTVLDSANAGYAHSPAWGGDAFWLADSGGTLRKLALPDPNDDRPRAELVWRIGSGVYPFGQEFLVSSPVVVGDAMFTLDTGGTLYRLDVAAGSAIAVGTPQLGTPPRRVEPVAAGDGILALFDGLVALDTQTAAVRWQAAGHDTMIYPPTVSGDTALWITTQPGDAGPGPGTLLALDVRDGSERWRVEFDAQPFFGGVTADAEIAVSGSPPAAYDLQTGELRWRAGDNTVGMGVPAIAGEIIAIATVDTAAGIASLQGFDRLTGATRWQVTIPNDDAPNLFDRLWVHEELVIIPTFNGAALAVHASDGTPAWEHHFAPPPLGALTLHDGRLYALLEDGDLAILDAATGELVARGRSEQFNLVDIVLNQRPIVLGDHVVFAAGLSLLGFEVTTP